jgi:hypothetical protein
MTVLSDQEFTARIFEIAGEPVEHFEPYVFNNTDGDCIEFFVSQDNYYGEWIDTYLTVYRSQETDEIVGFVISNVKRILDRLSEQKSAMAFVIDGGKAKLRSLLVSLFTNRKPDTDQNWERIVREYRKVAEIAESNKLDEVELICA